MRKPTWGPIVKARVRCFLEALLSCADRLYEVDDFQFRWEDSARPKLVVKTKRRHLERLTNLKQNNIYEVIESLKILEILDDNRTQTQGKEDWHFTLKLWEKDTAKNLSRFDREWENKRPKKRPILGKILHRHYRISAHLGSSEFSETYLAEDVEDLPDNPKYVVKRLKSQFSETSKRVFDRAAKIMYQLGKHNQIPSLFAHFEEDGDFYLVYQFIEGHPLSQELIEGQPWSEPQVIALLQDILEILMFVHRQNMIHRDIKPQNLIRRGSDSKIVLINFGAVKQVSTGQTITAANTNDYTSPEQAHGTPRLCSDVYAVGLLGIQTLTGLHSKKQFKVDRNTGDIVWRDKAQVSRKFADILDKMIRYHFADRYPSATEALQALQGLGDSR